MSLSYDRDDFIRILKQRLNTQYRKIHIDGKTIFITPWLEEACIDNIQFYISGKKEYVKNIEYIKLEDESVYVKVLNEQDEKVLQYRNKKNQIVDVSKKEIKIKDLSIDHTPSIYIVLYVMYLNDDENYNLLIDFNDQIIKGCGVSKINIGKMKNNKFKNSAQQLLEKEEFKDIKNIYKKIFSKIKLELSIDNTANLSYESLEYYRNNVNDMKS